MSTLEWLEALSYVVTIFGFPLAIWAFLDEKRKDRLEGEEELYQRLSDEYTNFLELVLNNADLHLMQGEGREFKLNDQQIERRLAIYGILISIFERAYILVYDDNMSRQTRRLWLSWEDYMREWCRKKDFCASLPQLLEGEDPDFRRCIEAIAQGQA